MSDKLTDDEYMQQVIQEWARIIVDPDWVDELGIFKDLLEDE